MAFDSGTREKYKAEHMPARVSGIRQVFILKSVFRRSGDRARERSKSSLMAENQIISHQDRSDSAPCAGVNSMVKLLRAHGGCLGRDRR